MSGPSRYQPSRRSRFRGHDAGQRRPSEPDPIDPKPVVVEPATEGADESFSAASTAEPLETATAFEYEPSPSAPATEARVTGFEEPEVWTPQPAAAITPRVAKNRGKHVAVESAPAPLPPVLTGISEELPAFQLRNVYEGPAPKSRGLTAIYFTLGSILLLALGATAGYLIGSQHRLAIPSAVSTMTVKPVAPMGLSAPVQAEVDAAFTATKQRRFADAQKQFAALHDAHPEWPSMAIESARAALYQLDAPGTTAILSSLTRNSPVPDATFLSALLHMTQKEFDPADSAFAAAVALDPARPEYYFFWGECLRNEGKPREASEKFQEALLRNQYETADDLYQLKLWLSRIQADQEESSGTNAAIDAGLATTPRPPFSAVFAAAAREIKAGRFKEAGALVARAQQLTDPVVFRVIMQDPTFVQESWRPELVPFYK